MQVCSTSCIVYAAGLGRRMSWEDTTRAASALFGRLAEVQGVEELQEVLQGVLVESGGDLCLLMSTWFVYIAEVYDPPIPRPAAKVRLLALLAAL